MDSEGGAPVMIKRAEIDTRAPFRSVKEAVTLFGEKVLAEELYPNKLKKMQGNEKENRQGPSKVGCLTAELEETKESLQKAKEEGMQMERCLSSLKEELDRTKQELQLLKERELEKQLIESVVEDVKIVEDMTTKINIKQQMSDEEDQWGEFQKQRYVSFANPPSVAQVMVPDQKGLGAEVLERHPSLRKKKKKPLIPLIGGIFSRKKGSPERGSSSTRVQ